MKIAIIGSNRGIGLELANQFNESGDVYAFCRKSSEKLDELNPHRIIENFDVTDKGKMSDLLAELKIDSFDVVLLVSGILIEDNEKTFEKDLINQFSVNAIGPINVYKSFSKYMSNESKFSVITSQLGSITNNLTGGRYGYRMSKAAANMACKNISVEAKDEGITVLMLHPGYVETDMTGHSADITTKESAEGLKRIINKVNKNDSGTFWHVNGKELPW